VGLLNPYDIIRSVTIPLLSSSTPSSSSLSLPSLICCHVSVEEETITPVPCHEPGTMARDDEHQRVGSCRGRHHEAAAIHRRCAIGSEGHPYLRPSIQLVPWIQHHAISLLQLSPPCRDHSSIILFAPAHRQPGIDREG
jgi:hypothetical protein